MANENCLRCGAPHARSVRFCSACGIDTQALERAAAPALAPHPTAPLPPAPLMARAAAKFIDLLPAMALVFMGAGLCASSSGASHNRWTEFWQWTLVAAMFVGAPAFVLTTGVITAAFGRMPGKALCRLRVVTPDGSPATANRMVLRALLELPGMALCFIGYLAALFDSRRRGLHDRLAGTQVIADPPDR